MQSIMLFSVLVSFTLFSLAELSRNSNTETTVMFSKASNVAANVEQYNDMLAQYVLANYDAKFGQISTASAGMVEHINLLDYKGDGVDNYSQKNLQAMLDYKSVAFDYTKASSYVDESVPVLYLATSWNSYVAPFTGYTNTSMLEVTGQLSQDLGMRLYQGDSTHWLVPWIFSQENCGVNEFFSQVPHNQDDSSQFPDIRNLFTVFCQQIEKNSRYRFAKYVYIMPIFKPAAE